VSKRRIGAHLSISGGLFKAVESIVEKGGNALQIFSSSPRMWLTQLPSKENVDRFKKLAKKYDIKPVFIHAKYLVNLASDKQELIEKSKQSLVFDMKVGEMIGAKGVIVHLGSHMGRGFEAVEKQLVNGIKEILRDSPGKCMFLIENSAGQKGKIGSQLSEIRLLIEAVGDSRVGWCYDTCHGFNTGYTLGKDWGNTMIQNDIVEEIDKLGILHRLEVLHINDSKDEFGSGHDRHENLGKGRLGLKLLRAYVNHPKLKHLPLIIETPGFDKTGPDKKNLDILKLMVKSAL